MSEPVVGEGGRAGRVPRLGLVGVALAALAVYAAALPNQLVWDDLDQVENNASIRRLADLPAALASPYWAPSETATASAGHWRPLTSASWVVSYAITGPSPAGFRAVNLLLHAACAVLVAILAAELGLAAAWALVAGLAFALHPVTSEAVVWVVGRAEVAAACGALLALVLWLRGTRERRPGLVAGALVALLAGLGFKESAASAVPIAAAIAFLEAEGGVGARLAAAARRAAPLLVPVVVFLVLKRLVLGSARYEDPTFFAGAAGWQVLFTMSKVFVAYLGLLAAPLRLRAHYDLVDLALPTTPADAVSLAALALDLALAAIVAWGLARRSRVALGGAWIAGGLLPFLHLVPFPWLMAERFLYLATAGFALGLAALGQALAARRAGVDARRVAIAVAAALVLLYAPRTVFRVLDWRDEVTFFGKMVEQEPDLAGARVNLASALAKRGRVAESMEHLRVAWQLGWRPWMTEPGAQPPAGAEPAQAR